MKYKIGPIICFVAGVVVAYVVTIDGCYTIPDIKKCNCYECIHPKLMEDNSLENMSGYDYEYQSGVNAAIAQFGSDKDSDLFVDLSNKRVISYVSDDDRQGYADGYHRALDILDSRNPKCPDFH